MSSNPSPSLSPTEATENPALSRENSPPIRAKTQSSRTSPLTGSLTMQAAPSSASPPSEPYAPTRMSPTPSPSMSPAAETAAPEDGERGELFEVDRKTGAAGEPIDFGLTDMDAAGLEFDPAEETLWLTDGPTLYRMDPHTGERTTIGDFDQGSGFNDLPFHLDELPCAD